MIRHWRIKYAVIEFIETPTFTRMVLSLLSDDEYLGLQQALIKDPQQGALLRAGGGIRKMRFALRARSKRDGVRLIYYWLKEDGQIYMLAIYAKSVRDDLTDEQVSILREFVKELKNG
jgi:hypothetical protein